MSVSVYVIRLNAKQNLDRNIYREKKKTQDIQYEFTSSLLLLFIRVKRKWTHRGGERKRERERDKGTAKDGGGGKK